MTLTLFMLFLMMAAICLRFKRPYLMKGFAAIGSIWLLLSGTGILPRLLLGHLQNAPKLVNAGWKERNIIFILGGGLAAPWDSGDSFDLEPWAASRAIEGARLYHECKKVSQVCRLLPSGGDPSGRGATEAIVLVRIFSELGVTREDLILEDRAFTTFQNAKYSAELIKDQNFDVKVLVTSGFHMQRSLRIFEKFGINTLPAPAERIQSPIRFIPIGSNIYYTDLALHELLGEIKYTVYWALDLEA